MSKGVFLNSPDGSVGGEQEGTVEAEPRHRAEQAGVQSAMAQETEARCREVNLDCLPQLLRLFQSPWSSLCMAYMPIKCVCDLGRAELFMHSFGEADSWMDAWVVDRKAGKPTKELTVYFSSIFFNTSHSEAMFYLERKFTKGTPNWLLHTACNRLILQRPPQHSEKSG